MGTWKTDISTACFVVWSQCHSGVSVSHRLLLCAACHKQTPVQLHVFLRFYYITLHWQFFIFWSDIRGTVTHRLSSSTVLHARRKLQMDVPTGVLWGSSSRLILPRLNLAAQCLTTACDDASSPYTTVCVTFMFLLWLSVLQCQKFYHCMIEDFGKIEHTMLCAKFNNLHLLK